MARALDSFFKSVVSFRRHFKPLSVPWWFVRKRKKLPASSRPRTVPPFGEDRRAKQNKTKKSAMQGALGVRRSKSSASLFP